MPTPTKRPSFPHARPAPRRAPGPPPQIADTVTWDAPLSPRERYRIVYRDRDGELSERTVDLLKTGTSRGETYYSVIDAGKPKTFRADRIVSVVETLTTGHPVRLRPAPTYKTELPPWPLPGAVFPIPQTANPRRTWRVDLNAYTCTCPEKRQRVAKGYQPGQLGMVCLHIAHAILDQLQKIMPHMIGTEEFDFWTPELLNFLQSRSKLHVDNLF